MEQKAKSSVEKIWDIFSSMKLGLALLGMIAFVAGIGTLFPQIDQDPEKANEVNQIWQTLGFTHVYSTVWFRLLLGLLCINLIVCSVQRFQGIYVRTFKPRPPANPSQVPQKIQEGLSGDAESLRRSVERSLKDKGYRVTVEEKEGNWSFLAVKRRWGNWGSLLTHIAFVILVLGALLGSFLGFKGYFMAGAGSTVNIQNIQLSKGSVKENFSVRINSAEDRFLPNGERDNWYTDMSIIENGQEVARKTISVNHPFTYQGVTFYQANFANGVKLTADVKGSKIPVTLRDRRGNYFQAPGTDLYLVAAAMKNDPQKPIILYQVYKGNGAQPIQTGQLTGGQTVDIQGAYQLTLDGNAGFTGLQVKRDPGVVIIWLGCALLLGGLLLSFYWRPMVISGLLQGQGQGNGQDKLMMGAWTGKAVLEVKAEFEAVMRLIKEG